jgi:hypothetical protein
MQQQYNVPVVCVLSNCKNAESACYMRHKSWVEKWNPFGSGAFGLFTQAVIMILEIACRVGIISCARGGACMRVFTMKRWVLLWRFGQFRNWALGYGMDSSEAKQE